MNYNQILKCLFFLFRSNYNIYYQTDAKSILLILSLKEFLQRYASCSNRLVLKILRFRRFLDPEDGS